MFRLFQAKKGPVFLFTGCKAKQIPFQYVQYYNVLIIYIYNLCPSTSTNSGLLFHCYVRLLEGLNAYNSVAVHRCSFSRYQDEVRKVPLPKGTSVKAGTRIPGVLRLITDIISTAANDLVTGLCTPFGDLWRWSKREPRNDGTERISKRLG